MPSEEQTHEVKKIDWITIIYLLIFAFSVVLIFVWYTFAIKQDTLLLASKTLEKIKILEKYESSAHDEKEVLLHLVRSLSQPLNYIAFWNVEKIEDQLLDMNDEINEEYLQILQLKKKQLTKELAILKQKIDNLGEIQIPSKTESSVFIQEIKNEIKENKITVKKLESYYDSTLKRKETLQNDIINSLNKDLAYVEEILEKNKGIDFNSKDETIAMVNNIQEELENSTLTDEALYKYLKQLTEKKKTIVQEVELAKKNLVFANIDGVTQEVNGLINFFNQRGGYQNEISILNQYKNKVTKFYSEKYENKQSEELKKLAESELYSLLSMPRQTKANVEEQERQAIIAQQRQAGIPEAPIKQGKVILISVPAQRLYAYENSVSIFNYPVPVTTGKAGYDTVKGSFSIYSKATNFRMRSPFPDEWYDNVVAYWMPFYQGYGLHDAYWRSVYGTMDYPYVGSHGCVNIPFAEVERLYYWAEIGTPVIVW